VSPIRSRRNGAAVGVPGTPLMWSEALQRYGTWPLKKTLRPAIDLAQTGFKVDATFSRDSRGDDHFIIIFSDSSTKGSMVASVDRVLNSTDDGV
jgi:gamma-glutamyltranspeptidase